MLPINMTLTFSKKCIIWVGYIFNQCFFNYQLPGQEIYFEFLALLINHYHINGFHLFWDSLEWDKWTKEQLNWWQCTNVFASIIYVSKDTGNRVTNIEDCIYTTIQRAKKYKRKCKERLITAASNCNIDKNN